MAKFGFWELLSVLGFILIIFTDHVRTFLKKVGVNHQKQSILIQTFAKYRDMKLRI